MEESGQRGEREGNSEGENENGLTLSGTESLQSNKRRAAVYRDLVFLLDGFVFSHSSAKCNLQLIPKT